MAFYSESPFERIIDIHWKPRDDGGNGGGTGETGCGSGWFAFGGYFPGGDGFPSQVTSPPVNLDLAGGVRWNPAFAVPPEGNPYLYFIPGAGAVSLTLSVVWAGILPPVTGLPVLGGIWIYPGRDPYPPWNDSSGNPPPMAEAPPFGPDFSFDIVGDGRFSIPEDVPLHSGTVVMSFAARSGPLTATASAPPPFIPSAADVTHYGFPGDPPTEGMWIEVEHDCGGL